MKSTQKKKFKPSDLTQELKDAVNEYIKAKAVATVLREQMDALDRRLLCEMTINTSAEWLLKCGEPVRRITEPKDTYLADEEQSAAYQARRQQEIDSLGFTLPRDYCPALVAEEELRQASHKMIEFAEYLFPGTTVNKLLCAGLDNYYKYIELLSKLVISCQEAEKRHLEGLVGLAADVLKYKEAKQ